MDAFTQKVRETRYYEQDVVGDTINSAEWMVQPAGPTLSGFVVQSSKVQALFSSNVPGSFVLTVKMSMASGQVLRGQARITVVSDLL